MLIIIFIRKIPYIQSHKIQHIKTRTKILMPRELGKLRYPLPLFLKFRALISMH